MINRKHLRPREARVVAQCPTVKAQVVLKHLVRPKTLTIEGHQQGELCDCYRYFFRFFCHRILILLNDIHSNAEGEDTSNLEPYRLATVAEASNEDLMTSGMSLMSDRSDVSMYRAGVEALVKEGKYTVVRSSFFVSPSVVSLQTDLTQRSLP
jgi:hypothetical protein